MLSSKGSSDISVDSGFCFSNKSKLNLWNSQEQLFFLFLRWLMFLVEISQGPLTYGKTFWSITPLICWLSSLLMMPTSTWEHKSPWGTLWPGCFPTGNLTSLCSGTDRPTQQEKHLDYLVMSYWFIVDVKEWMEVLKCVQGFKYGQ